MGLELAAQVHDIGKLTVPADLLTVPRKLTVPERNIVESQVLWGERILKDTAVPWPVAAIVEQHHERFDGSGYPHGLKAEDILLEARIVGVADAVEAMTSHRPYRAALGIDQALDEIARGVGTLYDPDVVAACRAAFEAGFVFIAPKPLQLGAA